MHEEIAAEFRSDNSEFADILEDKLWRLHQSEREIEKARKFAKTQRASVTAPGAPVRLCEQCGQPLPLGKRGPVKRLCSGRCRIASFRASQAVTGFGPHMHGNNKMSAVQDEPKNPTRGPVQGVQECATPVGGNDGAAVGSGTPGGQQTQS